MTAANQRPPKAQEIAFASVEPLPFSMMVLTYEGAVWSGQALAAEDRQEALDVQSDSSPTFCDSPSGSRQ